MTEAELIKLLCRPEDVVFETLAALPKGERRKLGAKVLKINKENHRRLRTPDGEILGGWVTTDLALLACCTLSQLKTLRWQGFPDDTVNVLKTFEIEFIEEWVDLSIETNPHCIGARKPIWDAGLCPRPTSDAYIMGLFVERLYEHNHQTNEYERIEFDDGFFETDVWRFFEVEGNGEYSLAANDAYTWKKEHTWLTRMLEYAETGKLDRGRLLDASLSALARDFSQYRAGWHSRFHQALKPTVEERTARTDAYLKLLRSAVPPTVSFAMKALKVINKASPIAPEALATALEPALQARQKGTVTGALQLLTDAAKRAPHRATEMAQAACHALISEDAGVQEKALALIERFGGFDTPEIAATLGPYISHLAPSQRARFEALDAPAPDAPVQRQAPQPYPPAASAEETLALFLELLEDDRDPFKIESAFDGMARFGAELRATKNALSPLRNRAAQLDKRDWGCDFLVRAVLYWCDGTVKDLRNFATYHNYDFHLRNMALLEMVAAGVSLPMLSMPTDTAGNVAPDALRERLAAYREAGIPPGDDDLCIALLRMPLDATAPEGFTPVTDAEHSFLHALCGDADTTRITKVAKEARMLREAQKSTEHLRFDIQVKSEDDFAWFEQVPRNEFTRKYDALQMHPNAGWLAGTQSDSAWHSLVCPGFPELYFRNVLIDTDSCYGAKPHHFDPFFRPGPGVGPVGASVLALALGDPHRENRQIATDAVLSLLTEGRLDEALFSEAFNSVFFNFDRPTKRFTESLEAISNGSLAGTKLVCKVILGTMIFEPDAAPRDYGSLLELLYHISLTQPDALGDDHRAFLSSLKGGGKIKTYARKLAA